MTKSPDFADLHASQGVHQRYAEHDQPLILHAKPTIKSWTLLDIVFTQIEDGRATEASADDVHGRQDASPVLQSKGTVKSLYEAQLLVPGTAGSEADREFLGCLKRSAWSWRNRFTFTSSTPATPTSSPILVEAVSGRFMGWQSLRVVYTDMLSGQRRGDEPDADGDGDADVLARVGRKRSAVLKCHWARTSELRDEESGALLMTIEQKKTKLGSWSPACFLMHHYIILRYKVRSF